MGSRRAIYNDIAPKPRAKNSSEGSMPCPRAEGPRARLLPEEEFLPEVEAAISLYIARRDPIYIIYIPLFMQPPPRSFFLSNQKEDMISYMIRCV